MGESVQPGQGEATAMWARKGLGKVKAVSVGAANRVGAARSGHGRDCV